MQQQGARRWRGARLAAVSVLSGALVVSSTVGAEAVTLDGDRGRARAIAASLDRALDAQGVSDRAVPSPAVELPASSGDPVVVDVPAGDIELGVPVDGVARQVDSGTAVYVASAGQPSVAVQSLATGVRALVSIPDAGSPRSYRFTFGGDVARIVAGGRGGVTLLGSDDRPLAHVAAPWARDAAGRAVRTHYEVDGTTLTQVVDHRRAAVAYPVVADPWIAAVALAAAAWCAKGALASIPTTALSDLIGGRKSPWKQYATNAVIGCLAGEIGTWVWKFLPGAAKTWAVKQVFKIAMKWRR